MGDENLSLVFMITRRMALASQFEQMIQQSVVSNYTALARLGRVTRSELRAPP